MSTFRPLFKAEIELEYNGPPRRPCHHIQIGRKKYCSFFITRPRLFDSVDTVSLVSPDLDLANVAAGLPDLRATLGALPDDGRYIAASAGDRAVLRVGVQGGIESGAANLLAKKMTTLVMVLEGSLLLKLAAPACKFQGRYRCIDPVCQESHVAQDWWPYMGAVSSDYDSHVPPIEAIKPATWNNQDPEHVCRVLSRIWSTPSREDLQSILKCRGVNCDFYLVPENREYRPEWWRLPQNGPLVTSYKGPKEYRTWFCFRYLQTTFKHTLLRNWVEVIARIVELALAGPDEYKKCLETIFRIQHDADQVDPDAGQVDPDAGQVDPDAGQVDPDADQGGVAWEKLMIDVLKLEHRIEDWRDQINRYEQGEVIVNPPKDSFLAKRMGPYDSRDDRTNYWY